jgi:hypothetical protein
MCEHYQLLDSLKKARSNPNEDTTMAATAAELGSAQGFEIGACRLKHSMNPELGTPSNGPRAIESLQAYLYTVGFSKFDDPIRCIRRDMARGETRDLNQASELGSRNLR